MYHTSNVIILSVQIETRVQETGANKSEISLSYSGGSELTCSDRAARTQILFSCGNSLGSPVFVGERFVNLLITIL